MKEKQVGNKFRTLQQLQKSATFINELRLPKRYESF